MNTLFLDFASHRQQFALVDETHVLTSIDLDDHKEEETLMPKLEELLKEEKMTTKDLTHTACVLGPGGFTSLRVGVSMANALSYGLKIPSCGIHLSDLWGEAAKKEKDFVWIHSTRKTSLFIRGFGTFAKNWPEPLLIDVKTVQEELQKASVVGELIPEHRVVLKESISMLPIDSFDSVLPAVLSQCTYKEGQILLPWYGREA